MTRDQLEQVMISWVKTVIFGLDWFTFVVHSGVLPVESYPSQCRESRLSPQPTRYLQRVYTYIILTRLACQKAEEQTGKNTDRYAVDTCLSWKPRRYIQAAHRCCSTYVNSASYPLWDSKISISASEINITTTINGNDGCSL